MYQKFPYCICVCVCVCVCVCARARVCVCVFFFFGALGLRVLKTFDLGMTVGELRLSDLVERNHCNKALQVYMYAYNLITVLALYIYICAHFIEPYDCSPLQSSQSLS